MPATPTVPRSSRPSSTESRGLKPRWGIYPDGRGGSLFAPTPDQWRVHEASAPIAIALRAELVRTYYYQCVRKHPALADFLYGRAELPAELREKGYPTNEMLKFQGEAAVRAILKAAVRPEAERWRHDSKGVVGEALLSDWRKRVNDHPWLENWLLRGEDPSSSVRVLSASVVMRARRAWDYGSICHALQPRISVDTYDQWFSRGLIRRIEWLKWLFGWQEPTGMFVVTAPLRELRKQTSHKVVLAAAGFRESTVWSWGQSPRNDLRAAASVAKAILAGSDPETVEGWGGVTSEAQQSLRALEEAASLEKRLERAGMSRSAYSKQLDKAAQCGAKELLLKYLRTEEPFTDHETRQSGLVAPNFFIPTDAMDRFRDEAIRRAEAENKNASPNLWALAQLSGFDAWFADWTIPKARRGKRHPLANAAGGQTTADTSSSLVELPAGDNDQTPEIRASATIFVPSQFQTRVLEALNHRARTATQLEHDLNVDRRRLFRDGLNPLTEHGLVDNKRGYGYFRPDAPPSGMTVFQVKNRESETEPSPSRN